ncbi:acyltransferase [Sphingomonas sp. HF-S3]|uniref:Acyltransferase n=1 Tax=Sphingomonas rustica TaxID=3103142 RepID=A0ABV0BAS3_9SPHN
MRGAAHEFDALTGLRGLAAIAVVFAHAENAAGVERWMPGQPFVDLFFALSGFVISYVYLRSDRIDWQAYSVARFARIYPLHIATAAAMAGAGVLFATMQGEPMPAYYSLAQVAREITLTMAMPLAGSEWIMNGPAWSISVEWWVYFLIFPPLALIHRRIGFASSALCFALLALILVVAIYALPADHQVTRGWIAFSRAAIGFIGGWVAYRAFARGWVPSGRTANLLAIATLIGLFAAPALVDDHAFFLILVYPFLIWALAGTNSTAAKLCAARPVMWLGTLSYSIYLIHPLVLKLLLAADKLIMPIEGRLAWVSLTVGVTLVAGMVSYRYLELPAREKLRSIRLPDHRGPVGALNGSRLGYLMSLAAVSTGLIVVADL